MSVLVLTLGSKPKYSFTSRIVNILNSLPNCVVDVHSVDLFKMYFDKFWRCQDVVFDWKADLTGTRDRLESCFECIK